MPIPIRAIGATGYAEEATQLVGNPISDSLTVPTAVAGDRLLAVCVVNSVGWPNTQLATVATPTGWARLANSADANIGVSARTTTYLRLFERTATGSDAFAVDISAPGGATDMVASFMGFVIVCRGSIAQVDLDTVSGNANNVNPTSAYSIDSHPTAVGGSLMFAAAALVDPLNFSTGGANGMTLLHTATGNGTLVRWSTVSVAEGSTTPTTAAAAQWNVLAGSTQWATVFITYGPYTSGIFVDGAVH